MGVQVFGVQDFGLVRQKMSLSLIFLSEVTIGLSS